MKPYYLSLRNKFSPNIVRIITNTSWLSFETIFRMGLSLLVGIWLARYLGPSLYGTLNYAVAFVGLFNAFLNMGLQGIVVHDLVDKPDAKNEILGTSFLIKLAGSYLSLIAIVSIIQFVKDGESLTKMLVYIIVASTLLFPFTNTIELWFQAKVKSKFSVIAKGSAFLLVSLLKIVFILTSAPLIAFAWTFVFESIFYTVALLVAYIKDGNYWKDWFFSLPRAAGMLTNSWPLILSAIGVSIYFKIDQIMLGEISNDAEVGIYSAAVRFSEVWYFLPNFIAASVFPSLIALQRTQINRYKVQLQRLYSVVAWLGIGISISVMLLAHPLITWLYGTDYSGAIPILEIHVWAAPFIFVGAILSKWLIMESLFKFSLIRHLIGAVVNVGLNFVLIPQFGGIGAAIATVISYMTASYLACFTYRATLPAAKMITLAYLTPVRVALNFVKERVFNKEIK